MFYLFNYGEVHYTHGDITTIVTNLVNNKLDPAILKPLLMGGVRELDLNHWEDYARAYSYSKTMEILPILEKECEERGLDFYEAPHKKLFYEETKIKGIPRIIMLTITSETLDRIFVKNGAGEWVQKVDGPIVKQCLSDVEAIMDNRPFANWKPFAHAKF